MKYKYIQRLGVKNLIEVYKKDLLARYISEHYKTNCFICKFAIYPMTDIQFLEIAHYFMKDNGVYFYNGSQIDFDELEEVLHNEYVNVELEVEELGEQDAEN